MSPPGRFLLEVLWASPGWRIPVAMNSSRRADPLPTGSSWRRAPSCRSGGLLHGPGQSCRFESSLICLWCQSGEERRNVLKFWTSPPVDYIKPYVYISPVFCAGCSVCWSLPLVSCCTVLLSEPSWLSPCSSAGNVPAGTLQPHLTNTRVLKYYSYVGISLNYS